jgi:isopentenyl phosphate kinase
MEKELTVLKLGGSLLTDKTKPYTLRANILASSAREISECMKSGQIQSLVLLHGVGSYGHPPVLEYQLHKGYQTRDQLLPLSKTQYIVNEFRQMIVKQLQTEGVPVNLMHPSSIVVSEKMKMTRYFLEPLKGYLSIGMVPLLGGDIIYDTAMGFSVGSADQLAVILANELETRRLIFVTDVAGIYEGDPKRNPDAALLEEINLNESDHVLARMGKSQMTDASGGMKQKLRTLEICRDKIKKGLDVGIISMMERGNLKAFLGGEKIKCTRITVA